MGASPRYLHAQPAQLTRQRAVGAGVLLVCVVPLLLAALPNKADRNLGSPVDDATWLAVARKMEVRADVPVRELLGAPVRSAILRECLDEWQIDVESFRRASARLRDVAIRTVFAADDRSAATVAATSDMFDLSLPQGFDLPRMGPQLTEFDQEEELDPPIRCAERLLNSIASHIEEND